MRSASTSLADGAEPKSAEVVLSLGGDGTMLRAVHLLDGAAVPVIGVNVGLLGYLAEVEPADMLQALERFFAGNVQRRVADDAACRDRRRRTTSP